VNLPEELDVLIIGAGMSGLAAGIRLAHFGQKVLILERHNAPGGLNSFYSIQGRKYDVGLHALTNFASPASKQAPLNKLLRQLRLSRDAWDLNEQVGSSIVFKTSQGEKRLAFNNDFSFFESQIAEHFPNAIDGFRRFLKFLEQTPMGALNSGPFVSTKAIMQLHIEDPLLVDMLLAPLLYYGSAHENDMDWDQACVMFQSIFKEGFARPYEGVRVIIRSLIDKYRANGGLRKMKTGIKALEIAHNKVKHIVLDDGSRLSAKTILSSAGYLETLALCKDLSSPDTSHNSPENQLKLGNPYLSQAAAFAGQLSFVETLSVLDKDPKTIGLKDTIVFFNVGNNFAYQKPESLVDVRSGVVCVPNNYHYSDNRQLDEGWLRITALANYQSWKGLSAEAYQAQKKHYFETLQSSALDALAPGLNAKVQAATVATDMFTPLTVEKYTGHVHGAIYGSSYKAKDGRTPFDNLLLCGTDQGFLGIIGAMMSGVSLANTILSEPAP
jgi:phytoene dehydrogenase-like protein